VPTALLDVVFTKLGDGTAVEERIAVPAVFDHVRYALELPDVIPVEFRALIPAITTEQTLPGDAVPPTPGDPNTLSASDEQLTEFTHRLASTTREFPTLPILLTGDETSSEFGGGILGVIRALSDDVTTIPALEGQFIVSSFVRPLGNGMFYNETKFLPAARQPWPTLVGKKYDEELQTLITEETQVVAGSYVPLTGTYFVESLKTIDKWRSQRIRVTKTPVAVDEASAIVTYAFQPFQFPGTFDYNVWLSYQHGMGFRQATAMLCKQKIKTWWLVRSPGPPTIGAVGSGADVEIDEIFTDTVTLPIYASGSVVESQKFPNVLHDAINTTQGLYFPATNPDFTTYYHGIPSGGTTTVLVAVIGSGGSGYVVGDIITFPGGFGTTTVTNVTGGGSIFGYSPTSIGSATGSLLSSSSSGMAAITGGSGTGATGETFTLVYTVPVTGSVWIGSERVVSVQITPTDIAFLWKVQTKSLVMH
jgi:hypothetical protein